MSGVKWSWAEIKSPSGILADKKVCRKKEKLFACICRHWKELFYLSFTVIAKAHAYINKIVHSPRYVFSFSYAFLFFVCRFRKKKSGRSKLYFSVNFHEPNPLWRCTMSERDEEGCRDLNGSAIIHPQLFPRNFFSSTHFFLLSLSSLLLSVFYLSTHTASLSHTVCLFRELPQSFRE